MISRQKARRIAYTMIYNALTAVSLEPTDEWDSSEKGVILLEVEDLLEQLKKKSQ